MAGIANGDGDAGDDDNEGEWVEVMNIWILKDYSKQQWEKEICTFPTRRRDKHCGNKMSIMTTAKAAYIYNHHKE
ncbi:hypothetical protein LguiA_029099 [Lonicera macranthoides]